MRIILLGPPGSGKGTIAEFISNRYCIPSISTGEILRDIIKKDTKLGNKIKKTINSGKLVSNFLVTHLLKKHIQKKKLNNGFLLDGFPRTIYQAHALKKSKIKIDVILELSITDNMIMERIIGRLVHEASGRIYHKIFNPPKIEWKDDITGDILTIRVDDHEDIILQRLKTYHNTSKILIQFYNKEASLGKIKYHKIDCMQSMNTIKNNLKNIFD